MMQSQPLIYLWLDPNPWISPPHLPNGNKAASLSSNERESLFLSPRETQKTKPSSPFPKPDAANTSSEIFWEERLLRERKESWSGRMEPCSSIPSAPSGQLPLGADGMEVPASILRGWLPLPPGSMLAGIGMLAFRPSVTDPPFREIVVSFSTTSSSSFDFYEASSHPCLLLAVLSFVRVSLCKIESWHKFG